jgi:hypothetical protein
MLRLRFDKMRGCVKGKMLNQGGATIMMDITSNIIRRKNNDDTTDRTRVAKSGVRLRRSSSDAKYTKTLAWQ